MAERRGFTITKFGAHADGYLHARVTPTEGRPVYVHRRFGSWLAPGTVKGQEVLKEIEALFPEGYEVKVALQDKARAWERNNAPMPIPQIFEFEEADPWSNLTL